MNERVTHRLARARAESHLPLGESLSGLDFAAVPVVPTARVMALAEADGWIGEDHDLLAFGPPGPASRIWSAGLVMR